MISKSIGQQYLDFIAHSKDITCIQDIESLFAPDIQKIVNSKLVCSNRNQLFEQMNSVIEIYGVKKIKILECINADTMLNVIRFEITYKDDTTESVISIIKSNDVGLITEINEVVGEKDIYQFP